MIEIEELKHRVEAHGMMCERYGNIWNSCQSRKQLFDMAASVQGSATLCTAIAEGWGLDIDYICNKFRYYINDRYISEQNGYTSKMYVDLNEPMIADATLVIIVGCNGSIEIPETTVCEVKLVNSNVTFTGGGICNVKAYGNCSMIYKDNVRHHEL